MTNEDLTKKMFEKKYFKEVTGAGKGLLGLIDPSFKRFSVSTQQKVVPQLLLNYYKPKEEGRSEGFGEYGIFACILNEKGEKELKEIKAELEGNGLINNIGNMRYESQDLYGCCLVDGFNDGPVEEGERLVGRYSTDNVYLYILTNDEDNGKIQRVNSAITCIHPKYGRTVYSINNV